MRPSAEAMLKLSHMLASGAFRWNDDTTPNQTEAIEALEDIQYALAKASQCFLEMNFQSRQIYDAARELNAEPIIQPSEVVVDLERFRKTRRPPEDES